MPIETSAVGSLTLPVETGGALSEFEDPTLLGLLSFLGFYLKDSLDDKLAELTPTSADACPEANRHPFDPESTYVRLGLPALYAWPLNSKRVQQTMTYEALEREIKVMYIFEELVKPIGMRARHGLLGAVDRIFAKASERGRHEDYAYGADALGTPIARSLNWVSWEFVGAEQGFASAIPGSSSRAASGSVDSQVQRGYPSLVATFKVVERIEPQTLVDPEERLGDSTLVIETGDEPEDTFEFLERILPPNDG